LPALWVQRALCGKMVAYLGGDWSPMTETLPIPAGKSGFNGLRVLSFESRRSEELARLIRNYGGNPILAPSMREVPLKDNHEALHLASELIAGRVQVLILLTGGGTRVLLRVVESAGELPRFLEALKSVTTIARGPKPVAALAEVGLRPSFAVPEPNTWRELLRTLDEKSEAVPLRGRTVAVQEYGASNQELLDGLAERGASVMRVPVYDWDLPEDLRPLRQAIERLAGGEVDVVLFTTSVQVRHLMQVAQEMHLGEAVRQACSATVVGSIGPVTSDELRHQQFHVDLEPSHPKMGFLVKELAEQSAGLLSRKRKKRTV
jgi:uroporphyrinogen-III synthase